MKTLTFYGSSDDNFCYDVDGSGGDEIGSSNAIWSVINPHTGEGMHVYGHYSPDDVNNGCWSVGLLQLNEDSVIPKWKTYFTYSGYTVELNIEAPDNVEVIRSS